MGSRHLILIGMLTASAAAASAQVVECIDANGRKEYSQNCPSGTVSQREIKTQGANEASTANTPKQKTFDELDAGFRQRQITRQDAEEQAARSRQSKENAERNCRNGRSYLKSLESGRRLRNADPVTGDPVYMEDSERAAETARMRRSLEERCKN